MGKGPLSRVLQCQAQDTCNRALHCDSQALPSWTTTAAAPCCFHNSSAPLPAVAAAKPLSPPPVELHPVLGGLYGQHDAVCGGAGARVACHHRLADTQGAWHVCGHVPTHATSLIHCPHTLPAVVVEGGEAHTPKQARHQADASAAGTVRVAAPHTTANVTEYLMKTLACVA